MSITLFRHTHPDCDALSSQNGLCSWIQANFQTKGYIDWGMRTTDQTVYPPSDIVDEIQYAAVQQLFWIPETKNVLMINDMHLQKM